MFYLCPFSFISHSHDHSLEVFACDFIYFSIIRVHSCGIIYLWNSHVALFFHISCVFALRSAQVKSFIGIFNHLYLFSEIFLNIQAELGNDRMEVQFLATRLKM
jgi:hypothetical protein